MEANTCDDRLYAAAQTRLRPGSSSRQKQKRRRRRFLDCTGAPRCQPARFAPAEVLARSEGLCSALHKDWCQAGRPYRGRNADDAAVGTFAVC